jgi:hypothetical protein
MKNSLIPDRILGQRALNRALLERQMLLRREKLSALAAIERLVGIQSQAPISAYYGLWTRLENFHQDELAQLIQNRYVVRIALMRSTIHLVSASDSLAFRPNLQSVLDRGLKSTYGSSLKDLNIDLLASAGRALVEEQPLTFSEVGLLLSKKWPEYSPDALSAIIRTLVPLIQVPPRGIWGEAGQATHTSLENWLGKPLNEEYPVDQMVLRYLAVFGPATIKDIQVWSGLTRLNIVIERLRPQLCTYHDEHGNLLYDIQDVPLPHPETLAPPRFLAEFDNMLLSYADRTRIISEKYRKQLFTVNGLIRAALLVDGFVCGLWRIERQHNTATLCIELYETLSKQNLISVSEEGMLLLKFAAAKESIHNIEFIPAK